MLYQLFGGKPPVAIPNAERRAFEFMIHALMLAVNNNQWKLPSEAQMEICNMCKQLS